MMRLNSAEITRARIAQIIDETNDKGRVTPGRVLEMFGVSRDTAERYLTRAAATGEVIRFGKCGLFRDSRAIADFNRTRFSYSGKTAQKSQNIIFQQCRTSEAMQRVLFVYGVHP